MPRPTGDRPTAPASTDLTRRQLLAGAGVSTAALLVDRREATARLQPAATPNVVFSRTTAVINEASRISRQVWAEVENSGPIKVPCLPRQG